MDHNAYLVNRTNQILQDRINLGLAAGGMGYGGAIRKCWSKKTGNPWKRVPKGAKKCPKGSVAKRSTALRLAGKRAPVKRKATATSKRYNSFSKPASVYQCRNKKNDRIVSLLPGFNRCPAGFRKVGNGYDDEYDDEYAGVNAGVMAGYDLLDSPEHLMDYGNGYLSENMIGGCCPACMGSGCECCDGAGILGGIGCWNKAGKRVMKGVKRGAKKCPKGTSQYYGPNGRNYGSKRVTKRATTGARKKNPWVTFLKEESKRSGTPYAKLIKQKGTKTKYNAWKREHGL